MKKFLCLLTVLLLALPCVSVAESDAESNPFDLLLVTDIFTNDDAEMDADGNYPDHVEPSLTVQGCFGTIGGEIECEYESQGFDLNDIRAFGLAEGCVLLLPLDLMNPVEVSPVTDLQAWYDAAQADYAEFGDGPYTFYALYELDDDGNLLRLEYCYLP